MVENACFQGVYKNKMVYGSVIIKYINEQYSGDRNGY